MNVPRGRALRRIDELIECVCRLVEARQRRTLAERTKAELNARRAVGPGEFLSDMAPVPPVCATRVDMSRFGPVLPTAVRRQIEKGEQLAREAGIANMSAAPAHMPRAVRWITGGPSLKRREHRATGNPHGRPRPDDTDLAIAVRELQRVFGIDRIQAIRIIAGALEAGARGYPVMTEAAARARVRRALALARAPAHKEGAITNA